MIYGAIYVSFWSQLCNLIELFHGIIFLQFINVLLIDVCMNSCSIHNKFLKEKFRDADWKQIQTFFFSVDTNWITLYLPLL